MLALVTSAEVPSPDLSWNESAGEGGQGGMAFGLTAYSQGLHRAWVFPEERAAPLFSFPWCLTLSELKFTLAILASKSLKRA